MPRKPAGERAMSNAERQKRYRDRHRTKAKDKAAKFRRALVALAEFYELTCGLDAVDFWMEECGVALRMDLIARAKGKPEGWVKCYLEGVMPCGDPLIPPTAAQKSANANKMLGSVFAELLLPTRQAGEDE